MVRSVDDVWGLTVEEIEELFRHRHMNNYVRAGLLTVKTSAWPRSGSFSLAESDLPPSFVAAVDDLLRFVERVNDATATRETRVDVTRKLFELYRELPTSTPADVPELLRVLAALAFVPLVAERNDGFPLWFHPPARPIRPVHEQLFELLAEPVSIKALSERFPDEMERREVDADEPLAVVNAVTIMAVQAIIIMIENDVAADAARTAFLNAEAAMRCFEAEHRIGGLEERPLGLFHPHQLRYRNTLYLYGGNLLERMGRYREARAWYLRDIDRHAELPGAMGFYLTALKTCERLLCAYRIDDRHPRVKASLLALIHSSLASSFDRAREYAVEVLAAVDANPGVDLSQPKVEIGGRIFLYAGESSREPLLAALLYRNMVTDVEYGDTDYSVLSTSDGLSSSGSRVPVWLR